MSEEGQPKKAAKKKSAKKRTQAGTDSSSSAKGKHWTFPKNSLEDSILVPKAIEEKNAGNPMPAQELAVAVGYRQAADWRFTDLLKSANMYGLVAGTGAKASISLSQLGQDIVAPSSPAQRTQALLSAFRNVEQFKDVEAYYRGKRIPEDEFFLNTLTREFKVTRDRVDAFSRIFVDNLKYLRSFAGSAPAGESVAGATDATHLSTLSDSTTSTATSREGRTREFLDTCFVMMPFGNWFDRYYQEIYMPAIKEAGYEPIRADELFSTGSVMEQIWEQIEKAKLLLADVSGKNPNVFYELGLAHAARKPVIFTASTVEDVPFDLRHLRVIVYGFRDPDWGAKLRRSVTDYLRNAAREPEKSIPHPFRSKPGDNASSRSTHS